MNGGDFYLLPAGLELHWFIFWEVVAMASANPLVEYWTYLAIDIVIVGGRVAARWKTLGLGNLAPDDFLMVVAIVSIKPCNRWKSDSDRETVALHSRDRDRPLGRLILVRAGKQRASAPLVPSSTQH